MFYPTIRKQSGTDKYLVAKQGRKTFLGTYSQCLNKIKEWSPEDDVEIPYEVEFPKGSRGIFDASRTNTYYQLMKEDGEVLNTKINSVEDAISVAETLGKYTEQRIFIQKVETIGNVNLEKKQMETA